MVVEVGVRGGGGDWTLRAAHGNRHPSTVTAAPAPYSSLLGNRAIMAKKRLLSGQDFVTLYDFSFPHQHC